MNESVHLKTDSPVHKIAAAGLANLAAAVGKEGTSTAAPGEVIEFVRRLAER